MKKMLSLAAVLLMPLMGMAADRLYVEDFTLDAGETATVEILLDNEITYSAIQADLYLPDGLSIVMDDGDYDFILTDRKGKNHTISALLQPDGAVRILIASQTSKTISGNSGALAVFQVTAEDDFAGGTILLSNVVASEANAVRHVLPDTQCTVTLPGGTEPSSGLELNKQLVKLEVGETVQLEVTAEGATQVTWTTSDPDIATVDSEGIVSAVAPGMVAITATAADGSSVWCAVAVEMKGDVNDDGDVSIADVTRLINILLSKE